MKDEFGPITEEELDAAKVQLKPSTASAGYATLRIDQDGDGDFWLYINNYPFRLDVAKSDSERMQKIYMESRGKRFVA